MSVHSGNDGHARGRGRRAHLTGKPVRPVTPRAHQLDVISQDKTRRLPRNFRARWSLDHLQDFLGEIFRFGCQSKTTIFDGESVGKEFCSFSISTDVSADRFADAKRSEE